MSVHFVFTLYVDPGHAWLKVPLSLLEELDLADKISRYSFRSAQFGYLEEDCDAYRFVQAWEKKHGSRPGFKTKISDRSSSIRRLPRFGGEE
jgi:hypothetical protein